MNSENKRLAQRRVIKTKVIYLILFKLFSVFQMVTYLILTRTRYESFGVSLKFTQIQIVLLVLLYFVKHIYVDL